PVTGVQTCALPIYPVPDGVGDLPVGRDRVRLVDDYLSPDGVMDPWRALGRCQRLERPHSIIPHWLEPPSACDGARRSWRWSGAVDTYWQCPASMSWTPQESARPAAVPGPIWSPCGTTRTLGGRKHFPAGTGMGLRDYAEGPVPRLHRVPAGVVGDVAVER